MSRHTLSVLVEDKPGVLTRALRRLRDLQYAMRVTEKGRAIYRSAPSPESRM